MLLLIIIDKNWNNAKSWQIIYNSLYKKDVYLLNAILKRVYIFWHRVFKENVKNFAIWNIFLIKQLSNP